jgi:ribulose-phosphate 3-epimerase
MKIIPVILEPTPEKTQEKLDKLIGVCDSVQIDVVDTYFANNETISVGGIKKLRTQISYVLHLMVNLADNNLLDKFLETQASGLTIYKRAVDNLSGAISKIKASGKKVGLALDIEDEVDEVEGILDRLDFVLVMGVPTGFAGQKFKEEVLPKISAIHSYLPDLEVGIDGGVDENIIKLARAEGADFVCTNTHFWTGDDPKDRFLKLSRLASL